MRKFLFFLFLPIVISCFLTSCNPFSENKLTEEEEILTKRLYEANTATGKHGYFPVFFIIGRLKTTPITVGLPAKIHVLKIAPALLTTQMKFKVVDSMTYQITYLKNENLETSINGTFGKNSGNDQFLVLATKSLSNEVLEKIKMIDYTFKIHPF